MTIHRGIFMVNRPGNIEYGLVGLEGPAAVHQRSTSPKEQRTFLAVPEDTKTRTDMRGIGLRGNTAPKAEAIEQR